MLDVFICTILSLQMFTSFQSSLGFSDGSVGKNPLADAGDVGSVPGSGRLSGEGNGNPLQYSCQEIPWTKETGMLQSLGSQMSQTQLIR